MICLKPHSLQIALEKQTKRENQRIYMEEETKKLPVKMYKETTYELASKAIYYPAEDSVK